LGTYKEFQDDNFVMTSTKASNLNHDSNVTTAFNSTDVISLQPNLSTSANCSNLKIPQLIRRVTYICDHTNCGKFFNDEDELWV